MNENNSPICISETNISHAWGKALLCVASPGRSPIIPLVVHIKSNNDQAPVEDSIIRESIDSFLKTKFKPAVSETASTIFPFKEWQIKGQPKFDEFTSWYREKFLPRYKARVRKVGHPRWSTTYFERMVHSTGIKIENGKFLKREVDQLSYIIKEWHHNSAIRNSALQVSIFDPAKDHTGVALSPFPCLQQLSFAHDEKGSLSITAYYPSQHLVSRAYGNYLGVYHLGLFVAKEMELQFAGMTCFAARLSIGSNISKSELFGLLKTVKSRINQ